MEEGLQRQRYWEDLSEGGTRRPTVGLRTWERSAQELPQAIKQLAVYEGQKVGWRMILQAFSCSQGLLTHL